MESTAADLYRGDAEGNQTADSVSIFEKEWALYSKIREVDFLEHKALYWHLEELLRSLPGTPLSVLDLGCGDCTCTAAALRAAGVQLASFTGVDSTAAALGLARPQLGFLPPVCAVELVQGDMQRWLRACQRQYSLVLASFAVHHLSRGAKAELLGHVARCLQPGGTFALIDVFKLAGESREAYMLRLKDYLDAELTDDKVAPEERGTLWAHMSEFDFPEELSTYEAMAAAEGLSCECMHAAPAGNEFFRLTVLRRKF